MKRLTTKTLTAMGLLIALEIIFSRFLSLNAWNMKIGFSFVPVVVAALLFGPVSAGIVAALGDLMGALLFPIGAYFPGFTLTAFLTGLVFGLFLYKKQSFWRVLAAVLLHQWLLSWLLNSFWISVLYGSPYGPLLVTRTAQCAVLTAVELALIPVLIKAVERVRGSLRL